MHLTSNDLVNAINSRRMAGVAVSEFAIHPDDYFFLEAEWLRNRDVGHPYHAAVALGVTLFVKHDAPRLQA